MRFFNRRGFRFYEFFFTAIAEEIEPKPHEEFPDITFYPCVGYKSNYPYVFETYQFKEMSWEYLGHLSDIYHEIYKVFRRKYKWSPRELDCLPLWRIMKIFYDVVDELEEENVDEDDFS